MGYKGVGGCERESRDVDVSRILDYGLSEYLDKFDGITDEESKCIILVLAILEALFGKEMYTHFDMPL